MLPTASCSCVYSLPKLETNADCACYRKAAELKGEASAKASELKGEAKGKL